MISYILGIKCEIFQFLQNQSFIILISVISAKVNGEDQKKKENLIETQIVK